MAYQYNHPRKATNFGIPQIPLSLGDLYLQKLSPGISERSKRFSGTFFCLAFATAQFKQGLMSPLSNTKLFTFAVILVTAIFGWPNSS